MTRYLLSVHGNDEDVAAVPAEEMHTAYAQVDAFNAELTQSGSWVFAGGLQPASTATVVKVDNGETIITDGPFAETKEQLGGFWIIEAADLDAALEWARKGSAACMNPVEVRPFQDMPES
jgi:hypothetical protein